MYLLPKNRVDMDEIQCFLLVVSLNLEEMDQQIILPKSVIFANQMVTVRDITNTGYF